MGRPTPWREEADLDNEQDEPQYRDEVLPMWGLCLLVVAMCCYQAAEIQSQATAIRLTLEYRPNRIF
jgi:hypothetical protein